MITVECGATSSVYAGIKCEIQVRTIHEEGWAEIEHRLKYKPQTSYGQRSILESQVLVNLSYLFEVVENLTEEVVVSAKLSQDQQNVFKQYETLWEAINRPSL